MKLISIFSFLIFTFSVIQFLGCSLSQRTISQDASLENKAINSPLKTPRIADNPANIADQNFVKEWKDKYDITLTELEKNLRLWQESEIANYNCVTWKFATGATSDWNAFQALIKVRNNQNISIESKLKQKDFRVEDYKDFDSIDKIFKYIRQELDNGRIVYAKYDKKSGYPKSVIFDYSFMIDDERGIAIEKFEIVK